MSTDAPHQGQAVRNGSNGVAAVAPVVGVAPPDDERCPLPPELAPLAELSPSRDAANPTLWRARCPACDGTLEIRDVDWNEATGERRLKLYCGCSDEQALLKLIGVSERDLSINAPAGRNNGNGHSPIIAAPRIVSLEEFADVDEQGADPIVGAAGSILIPQGGDVMFYGDGGAGKTTLSVDLAFHLASATDWLGMPVPRPVRVLLIENEGPRPLFRQKLRRKLDAWQGSPIGGRVTVFEHPWAQFTFAVDDWRALLAHQILEHEIDVLIAGPLTRLGMDTAGTLQEVRAFMELVERLRWQCERRVTVILVHHENKGGAVSGAWEGAGDTLLHVQAAGNGHTVAVVQKARWDSERHGTTLHLAWADGDGFRLEGDRDYFAEIVELLSDGDPRTIKEIAAPDDDGGIGAGEKAVKIVLNEHPERFLSCSGKEVGRSPRGTFWQLRQGSNALDAVGAFSGGAEDAAALRPSLKGAAADEHTPGGAPGTALDGSTHPTQDDVERWAAMVGEAE